jgi:deazaflavin-dependent oxidoreductase (nitroreductase family)
MVCARRAPRELGAPVGRRLRKTPRRPKRRSTAHQRRFRARRVPPARDVGLLELVAPQSSAELTHTGAKSGVTRTSTVVYFTDADRVIVIASNFGVPHRPAWYYNVKAHPEVTLSGRGFGGSFHAEELVGPERDRLFQLATGASSPYDHYQRTARKPVPVIAFHPSR